VGANPQRQTVVKERIARSIGPQLKGTRQRRREVNQVTPTKGTPMKEVLNGSNPAADKRLMDAVEAAVTPDPFDGGCPADCEPAPVTIKDISRGGMELGVQACITRLCQMDMWTAADALKEAHSRGEVLK
jgi:hypothetical protein